MVADSLRPPPGMSPVDAPPRGLTSFWARVSAATPEALTAGLAHLAPFATLPGLRRGLIHVRWAALLGAPKAADTVRAFVAARPEVLSSWVPQCHPGAPQFETLGGFATPPDCPGCVFYRGRVCQGLGDERVPFGALAGVVGPDFAPPALQPVPPERDPRTFVAADFLGPRPVCYWRPARAHIAAIGAAVRAAGGTLWDLGAGNGFLSSLLAADEGLQVTAVDQLGVYPTPAGVRRFIGDVRGVPGPAPAALLISWPPGGDGFRDVVRRLRPEVLVLAYDTEGFCGRRRGHAEVEVTPEGLQWFTSGADDFAPSRGLPRRERWQVACHQDLTRGRASRSGLLEIRARTPTPPPIVVAPLTAYPWE